MEWSKLFVAGAIGAMATTLVSGLIAVLVWSSSSFEEAAVRYVFRHADLHAEQGFATTDNNDYRAPCQSDEKIVGGFCELQSGDAALFNAGVTAQGEYHCTYRSNTNIKARIYAWCLK